MYLRLTRQGDDFVLLLAPSLVEQAGLSESSNLEVTVAGSAIVVAPLPVNVDPVPERGSDRGDTKDADVLRRLAE